MKSGQVAPPTILLMLKAPIEGQVKTRLGREVGLPAATLIYRRLVEHQMREIPSGWPTQVCFAPAEEVETMRTWLGQNCSYSAQAEGDLGARLAGAATEHFQRSTTALVIIGGDCPALNAELLGRVADALVEHEVVIVPAADGGYCLIALRTLATDLFREISWSTETVLEETRARLAESGARWQELETLEDVDDRASWRRAVAAFPDLEIADGPK